MATTVPTDRQRRDAAPSPAARLSVDSEVGPLRRVILHRPDLELKPLTPSNEDALDALEGRAGTRVGPALGHDVSSGPVAARAAR